MRIGLSYDLKDTVPLGGQAQPEDALEEYDSLETVEAISVAIEAEGHSVIKLGGGIEFITNILRHKLNFVFNIAEGVGNYISREAQVPSILEMLQIPYSGSDPKCLAICLDKPMTKKLVAASGIPTPKWQIISSVEKLNEISWDSFIFPTFVKPTHEGSSKGIRLNSRVEKPAQLAESARAILEQYQQPALVEEYIDGNEITVGIVGNSPPTLLGPMRILPREKRGGFVYSLEVKRDWENLVEYECPARLEANVLQKIAEFSLTIFEILSCRDYARLDFRVSPEGTPYFLEINPLPGLNPKSGDLPIMATKMGWSYQALISTILHAALGRYLLCNSR